MGQEKLSDPDVDRCTLVLNEKTPALPGEGFQERRDDADRHQHFYVRRSFRATEKGNSDDQSGPVPSQGRGQSRA